MNLNDLLAHYRRTSPAGPAGDVELLIRLYGERHLQTMASQILRTGDIAPNLRFDLGTADSQRMMDLDTLVAGGPTVLKFYRGRWCPYCTLELRAYQRSIERLRQAGGKIIALSPQSALETDLTRSRDRLTLALVVDRDNRAAAQFGLAYSLDADERQPMESLGVDLPRINGRDVDDPGGWSIALPALYLIGAERRITYAFVDPDHRRRAEPEHVIAAIEAMIARS